MFTRFLHCFSEAVVDDHEPSDEELEEIRLENVRKMFRSQNNVKIGCCNGLPYNSSKRCCCRRIPFDKDKKFCCAIDVSLLKYYFYKAAAAIFILAGYLSFNDSTSSSRTEIRNSIN